MKLNIDHYLALKKNREMDYSIRVRPALRSTTAKDTLKNALKLLTKNHMQIKKEKECTQCGIEKKLSFYHRNKRAYDGRQSICKTCRSKLYKPNSIKKHKDLGTIAGVLVDLLLELKMQEKSIEKLHKIEQYHLNRTNE